MTWLLIIHVGASWPIVPGLKSRAQCDALGNRIALQMKSHWVSDHTWECVEVPQ